MNNPPLNSQKEKHSMLSLRRATGRRLPFRPRSRHFYPRSPCGERPRWQAQAQKDTNFYPRSPCGERRVTVLGIQHRVGISIHALLAESDAFSICSQIREALFLSTLSLRRATTCCIGITPPRWISIHALLAESDPQFPY